MVKKTLGKYLIPLMKLKAHYFVFQKNILQFPKDAGEKKRVQICARIIN